MLEGIGGRRRRGREDEMAGWHHWLDGRESEWTPGVGDRQGGLACCDSWGCKDSDMTERLNWTELRSCLMGNIALKSPKAQYILILAVFLWFNIVTSLKTLIISSQVFLIYGASLVAQMVKNLPIIWETQVRSLDQKIHWRREWQPTLVFLENSMDRGPWWAIVHGVSKSWTRLSV